MAKAGAFSSREHGLIGLGILAGDGIEGELKEESERTFRLGPSQSQPFYIDVDPEVIDQAQEILNRHQPTLDRFLPEAADGTHPSAASPRVPLWPWLVIGGVFLVLIANRDKGGFLDRTPPENTSTVDRNQDGRPDGEYHYNSSGVATSARFDNNFDGIWDHIHDYGDLYHHESSSRDLDFDGFFEETVAYQSGLIQTIEIREAEGKPILRQYDFKNGVFLRESIDRDGDGEFEEVITYDPLGNVAGTSVPEESP